MKHVLGSAYPVLQNFMAGGDSILSSCNPLSSGSLTSSPFPSNAFGTLIALDFDGTLAPLHSRHEAATMRERTAALLVELARLVPVAVVSGRGCDDLNGRLPQDVKLHLIGNHGLEPSIHLDSWRHRSAAVLKAVAAKLARLPGVEVEDKGPSFAVHFRHARRTGWTKRRLHAILENVPHAVRLIGGKAVINVLPADASDKGQSTWQLVRDLGCTRLLYVGDDVTDEDVFRTGNAETLLSIRVGRSRRSFARYYIENQSQIDVLLQRLIELIRQHAPPSHVQRLVG